MNGRESSDFRADGKCFLIAEIGTGHGGDAVKARELIDAAREAGADCAKFQIVFADEIIHPNTGIVPLPGGDIRLYDRFRELEESEDFYAELKSYTESRGLRFLCSPFGIRSARLLRKLEADILKIASPELNYTQLLEEVSAWGLPIVLSSGVSTLADIEKALAITGKAGTVLLHCITSYPAPEEEYNVRLLSTLSAIFGVVTGISDHSLDPVLVPVLSVLQGGKVIEKHFTLSRKDPGLDDPIALTPADFRCMVNAVRNAELQTPDTAVQELEAVYTKERVEAVLGTGVKELAPAERANYGRTNRSLHAVHRIPAGTTLATGLVAVLRTEKILRPGLPPDMLGSILGKKTVREIPAGEGIVWEDLLSE